MKTAELTGAELDYWVARADGCVEGKRIEICDDLTAVEMIDTTGRMIGYVSFMPAENRGSHRSFELAYSTDPMQGHPIIEREKIELFHHSKARGWIAKHGTDRAFDGEGASALIAAMRCYVASKFGDEVQD